MLLCNGAGRAGCNINTKHKNSGACAALYCSVCVLVCVCVCVSCVCGGCLVRVCVCSFVVQCPSIQRSCYCISVPACPHVLSCTMYVPPLKSFQNVRMQLSHLGSSSAALSMQEPSSLYRSRLRTAISTSLLLCNKHWSSSSEVVESTKVG